MTTNKRIWVRLAATTVMAAALVTTMSMGSPASGAAREGAPPVSNALTGAGGTLPKGAGLSAWQAAVDNRIGLRLATLQALKIAIGGATNLTSGDKSTLSGIVSADISGLTALKTKTDGETTVAAVRLDRRSMIDDYRIYMLVVPKVRFAIASDQETVVLGKLQTAHDKLAGIATQLAGEGKDVTSERAELTDMANQIAAATSTLSGKSAGLLGVAPSADAAAMVAAVAPVRAAVRGARTDLKAALADGKKAGAGLKALA